MWYLNIEFLDPHTIRSTVGVVLQAVHGVIAAGSEVLAVDFPNIDVSDPALLEKARCVRVFGSFETLEALKTRREMQVLQSNGEVALNDISEAPITQEHVICRRVRQAEHAVSPSRARRHARRAAARGEPVKTFAVTSSSVAPMLSFPLHSYSTGQSMVLHIRREKALGPARLGTISSYGLSGPDSALPAF